MNEHTLAVKKQTSSDMIFSDVYSIISQQISHVSWFCLWCYYTEQPTV